MRCARTTIWLANITMRPHLLCPISALWLHYLESTMRSLHLHVPRDATLRSQGLSRDFGIRTNGSVRNVNYTLTLGDIEVAVDWANTTGNGDTLTSTQIREHCVHTHTHTHTHTHNVVTGHPTHLNEIHSRQDRATSTEQYLLCPCKLNMSPNAFMHCACR